jgi:uncharacterized protein (DUF952 family)
LKKIHNFFSLATNGVHHKQQFIVVSTHRQVQQTTNFLHDHPEIMMDMEQKIRAIAGLNGQEDAEFSAKDEEPIELD